MHYARHGDVRLAYRIFGDSGPVVVWSPGWVVSNVDTIDEPNSPYKRLIDIMSESVQLVVWDRRGTGLSDPAGDVLTFDDRVDDLVDHIVSTFGGQRANHTDDGIFAIFDAPSRAVRCALELVPSLAARDIPIRVGLHTGEQDGARPLGRLRS